METSRRDLRERRMPTLTMVKAINLAPMILSGSLVAIHLSGRARKDHHLPHPGKSV